MLLPGAWLIGIFALFGMSIAGLRRVSAKQFYDYRRLALLGVAWMAALVIYVALAIVD